MRKIYLACFVLSLVMCASTITEKPFHKESYGTVFYGSNTSISHTFREINIINWSAFSSSDKTIYVSFRLSGGENCVESFSLSNSFAFKSGSIGNAGSLSDYSISGSATCNNPPSDQVLGRISFDAFNYGLN